MLGPSVHLIEKQTESRRLSTVPATPHLPGLGRALLSQSADRVTEPGRSARPAPRAGPRPRCAAEALRGGRKCVPSGYPCSAPARRSPAPQVSGEGGGGRGRAGGGSPGGTGKPRAGPRGREPRRHRCGETPEATPGRARVPGPVPPVPPSHFRGARAGPGQGAA